MPEFVCKRRSGSRPDTHWLPRFSASPLLRLSGKDSELNRAFGPDDRTRRTSRHFVQRLIAIVDQHRQTRRHCNRLQIEIDAEPLTDFLAERGAMGVADLDAAGTIGRGATGGRSQDELLRSPCEKRGLRKQDAS
ncbi:hypothetical protein [Bradyrhizobium sp. LB13.1]